jgi:hypothetical protein
MADYETNNQTKENLLNDLKNKFKVRKLDPFRNQF